PDTLTLETTPPYSQEAGVLLWAEESGYKNHLWFACWVTRLSLGEGNLARRAANPTYARSSSHADC
ncbi:MAG: hypothetical protein K2Q15_17080, partial [Burkholderiales bacterium]|nr:hypothetical protein [Burkholderiales bacterium]